MAGRLSTTSGTGTRSSPALCTNGCEFTSAGHSRDMTDAFVPAPNFDPTDSRRATTVTVHGLGELIALIPYQLGYHPSRAVVALTITEGVIGGAVAVPEPPGTWQEHPAELWESVHSGLINVRRSALGEAEADVEPLVHTVVVGYEDTPGDVTVGLLDMLDVVERAGLLCSEIAVVRAGRWHRLGEPDQAGYPVPTSDRVGAVAEFVGLGVNPVAHRELIRDALAEDPARSAPVAAALADIAATDEARSNAAAHRLLGARRLRRWLSSPDLAHREEDPADTAAALDLLKDDDIRDAVYALLAPGLMDVFGSGTADAYAQAKIAFPDGCRPGEAVALLTQVAALAPTGHRALLLGAIALGAWVQGNGAVAAIAAEEALADRPGSPMAELVLLCITHGRTLDDLRRLGAGSSSLVDGGTATHEA